MLPIAIEMLSTFMVKRSLRRDCVLVFLATAALLFSATPSSSSQHPVRKVEVNLQDTGKTVALAVGQELIVTLPMKRYDDNYWYVARNSGAQLKLIAGPDTRRPRNWTPFSASRQVFYFRREAPGVTSLVLEQSYWSKPMILKVVDP
jgi:hypothetical protein